MISSFKISLVVPAYNEESNLQKCAEEVISQIKEEWDYELIFVDDGSTDNSLKVLKELHESNDKINFLSLSRNFGHQSALRAGIAYSTGDCTISMDADLQHPPSLIHEMVEKWQEGYDIVSTIRGDQKNLPKFKRHSSSFYYRFLNSISSVKINPGSADFRLIDRKIVEIINQIGDPFFFLRGIVPWLGFKQYVIEFTPNDRYSGETKYSMRKMTRLAVDGMMSLSIRPLRMATVFGLIVSALSFCYGIYAVLIYFFSDNTVSGWASTIASIMFIGGMQFLFLGIIGEYVGKIFIMLKNRPNYLVKENSLKN